MWRQQKKDSPIVKSAEFQVLSAELKECPQEGDSLVGGAFTECKSQPYSSYSGLRTQDSGLSLVNLALLLTLATIPTAATLLVPAPMLAQSPSATPAFPLLPSVPNGTTVRIDGSDSLGEINQGLKQSFEQQFSGTKVEVTASDTDSGLKALQDGKVDLVALSRGLTKEEKAQGLEQVRLRREKIAIVVGAGNPFQGSLTSKQFLQIFRGEITDWSELGASKGKIRVIDRPTTSDTRQNLRNYPAFKTTNFVTGANGTQLPEDNTAEIVKQLGNDGISYGLATQLSKLESVRVLQINQAALDDAKYPFSQPLVYAYKKKPNPGVAAFLSFAIAPPGQTAIDAARTAQAQTLTVAANPSPIAEVTTTPSEQPSAMMSAQKNASENNPKLLLWFLLPVIGGLLLWLFLRRRSSTDAKTDNVAESTSIPPGEDGTFAHTDSNLDEGTNLTPSNTGENLSSAGNSAATDGIVPNPKTENIVNNDTKNNSNSAVTITPESGETTWDIEAPASIVNTPYPQLPDVPIIPSNVELPTTELPTSNPELTNLPEVTSFTDNWNIESVQEPKAELPQTPENIPENTTSTAGAVLAGGAAIAAISGTGADIQANNETIQDSNFTELDSPELPEITTDAELPTVDASHAVPELPEITTDAELPTVDASHAVPELPEITTDASHAVPELPEITTDAELPTVDASHAVPELPEITTDASHAVPELPEITTDAELPTVDASHAVPELPEITTDAELPTVDASHAVPELPEITTDAELPTVDASHAVPELPEIATDAELPTVDASHAVPELPEIATDAELPTIDASHAVSELPDLPEVALNAVADAAEPTTNFTEDDTVEIISNLPEETNEGISNIPAALASGAALAAGAGIGAWTSIDGIQKHSESDVQAEHEEIATNIVLTPHTPKWAYATWQISDTEKLSLQNAGVSQLVLRLYDVTGIDLSYQAPHLVQQYELDSATHDRFINIPTSDRDYITEIGYATPGDRWESIARSATVRVFSHPYVETVTADSPHEEIATNIVLTPHTPKWAYATWQISETQKLELQNAGVSQLALRLYDVTGIDLSYQAPHLVQQYELDAVTDDRFINIPTSDRDYITELGYVTSGDRWESIARSATVRVFSHPYVETVTADSPHEEIPTNIVLTPQSPTSVHATWQISETEKLSLQNAGVSQLALRLYDVTGIDLSYQAPHLVQQYELDAVTDDRFINIPTSDRDYITEIGYATPGDRWESIARSATVRVFSHPYVETVTADSPHEEIPTNIVLTPQSPTSVHATWQISETQKLELQNAGVSQLALRLYDVTGIDLSYQTPHLVQQYELDAVTDDRFINIPNSDRDYITELGYVTSGERWESIARSAPIRVFSHPYVETVTANSPREEIHTNIVLTSRTPKWAYVAWQITDTQKLELQNAGVSQLALRLYDVTGIDLSYQTPHLVQQYELDAVTDDRFINIPNSDRDYITELGYVTSGDRWESIARSATVRIFSHPQTDFWFVADAELIIHGATEPNATVTIGQHTIKLKPDGTFHLRIPFSNSLIEYLITAAAADGGHAKTIHKKFSQETPEA